jgi:hypothetical protein
MGYVQCRKWASTGLLKRKATIQLAGGDNDPVVRTPTMTPQRCIYLVIPVRGAECKASLIGHIIRCSISFYRLSLQLCVVQHRNLTERSVYSIKTSQDTVGIDGLLRTGDTRLRYDSSVSVFVALL